MKIIWYRLLAVMCNCASQCSSKLHAVLFIKVNVPVQAVKALGRKGVEVYRPSFLTWTLDGGEWSTSRPCRFTPGERTPGTK